MGKNVYLLVSLFYLFINLPWKYLNIKKSESILEGVYILTTRTLHHYFTTCQIVCPIVCREIMLFPSQFQTSTHFLLLPSHLCHSCLISIVTWLICNSPSCMCVCALPYISWYTDRATYQLIGQSIGCFRSSCPEAFISDRQWKTPL